MKNRFRISSTRTLWTIQHNSPLDSMFSRQIQGTSQLSGKKNTLQHCATAWKNDALHSNIHKSSNVSKHRVSPHHVQYDCVFSSMYHCISCSCTALITDFGIDDERWKEKRNMGRHRGMNNKRTKRNKGWLHDAELLRTFDLQIKRKRKDRTVVE